MVFDHFVGLALKGLTTFAKSCIMDVDRVLNTPLVLKFLRNDDIERDPCQKIRKHFIHYYVYLSHELALNYY